MERDSKPYIILSAAILQITCGCTEDRLPSRDDTDRSSSKDGAGIYDAAGYPDENIESSDATVVPIQVPDDTDVDSGGSSSDQSPDLYIPPGLLDEPGFRESEGKICTEYSSTIWSDESGVFAFGDLSEDRRTGRTLYFNDGTGWSLLCDRVPVRINDTVLDTAPFPERVNIAALSGSKYLIWNEGVVDGIRSLTVDETPCEFPLEYAAEEPVRDLFVVNEEMEHVDCLNRDFQD